MSKENTTRVEGQDAGFFKRVQHLVGVASMSFADAKAYADGIQDPELKQKAQNLLDDFADRLA